MHNTVEQLQAQIAQLKGELNAWREMAQMLINRQQPTPIVVPYTTPVPEPLMPVITFKTNTAISASLENMSGFECLGKTVQ